MWRGRAFLCTVMGALRAWAWAVGLAVRLELRCAPTNEKTTRAHHSTSCTMEAMVWASIGIRVRGVLAPFSRMLDQSDEMFSFFGLARGAGPLRPAGVVPRPSFVMQAHQHVV